MKKDIPLAHGDICLARTRMDSIILEQLPNAFSV